MEALKNSIKKRNIKLMIVTMLIGIAITLIMFKDWLPGGDVQNLDTLEDINELREGKATVTAFYVEDYYMYYTEGNSEQEVERCFLMPVGGDDDGTWAYIGLHLWGKNNKKIYRNMETIYQAETIDESLADTLEYISLSGHVREMDSDNEYYLNEYIKSYSELYGVSEDEERQYYKYYIFEPNRITGAADTNYSFVFAIFGFVFLGAGFYYLIQVLFGDPLKPVVKYGNAHGSVDRAMAKAEYLLNNQSPVNGMRGDDEMFMYYENKNLMVYDPKDMLWAYEHIVKRKSGLITVGKDYSVLIRLADGSQASIPCIQSNIGLYMNSLQKVCPDIILGYSDELKRMYTKDRYRMVAEINRRREERLGRVASMNDKNLEEPNATDNSSSSSYEGTNYNYDAEAPAYETTGTEAPAYGTIGTESTESADANNKDSDIFADGGFWK